MMNFKLGCDPELFLVDGGKFISSIGLIGGSKQNPLPIGEGCSIQEDNVAVEFGIPPAESCESFVKSIQYTLNELADRCSTFNLKFSQVASANFTKDQLDHPMAFEFGCEPDFNAWTGKKNPRPKATDETLRSAGGHVHVGVKGLDKRELIKAMDFFLGVPSTKLDPDTRRRELYGCAGSFRPKPYGVEYRTLSNFWIWDERLIKWVYDQSAKAISYVAEGNKIDDDLGAVIQDCINNNNVNAYNHINSKYHGAF